jgi:hypothetical protein
VVRMLIVVLGTVITTGCGTLHAGDGALVAARVNLGVACLSTYSRAVVPRIVYYYVICMRYDRDSQT